MSAHATVHIATDWFDPVGSRKTTIVAIEVGMTLRDLVPEDWGEGDTLACLDGDRIAPENWSTTPVLAEAVINFVLVPGSEAFVAAAVEVIIELTVAAAISYAIVALLPGPDQPADQEDNSSQTYGWSGVRTVYDGIGLPAPLALGNGPALGGVAIQQWVETRTINGHPVSTLNVLLLLTGPGPIGNVGGYSADVDNLTGTALPVGMRIDANNAQNYDGVSVSLRMGSQEQEPIPGFNQVRNSFAVNLPIDNVAQGEGSPTTDFSDAAVYDMTVVGDASIVTVTAPGGLHHRKSTGGLENETVDLQVRYIELVGGVPSGSYVTLDPYTFTSAELGRNSDDYAFDFFDPATYTTPAVGSARDIPFNRAAHVPGTLTAPEIPGGSWTYDDLVDEITVEVFVDVGYGNYMDGCIASWATGTITGVEPGELDTTQAIQGFNLRTYTGQFGIEVSFEGGTGSTLNVKMGGSTATSAIASLDETGTNQVGFSYKADALGDGLNRWRLIVNGAIADEVYSVTPLKIPSLGTTFDHFLFFAGLFFGRLSGGGSSGPGRAKYDQAVIWAREVEPFEIAGRWRVGLGTFETEFDDKVAAYDFGTTSITADRTGNGNTLIYDGSSVGSTVTGILADPGTNTIKQATYRVEVQRRDNVGENDRTRDKVEFSQIQTIRYDEIAYSGWALAGIKITETEQLNSTRPNITFDGSWIKGLQWDGNDPDNPTLISVDTATPAWLEARYLLDQTQGLGPKFNVEDLDWPAFLEWAEYSEENLPDGRGERQVIIHSHQKPGSDDLMRIEFAVDSGGSWPAHWKVGQTIALYGETVSAPAWAITLIDDNELRGYTIVDGPYFSGPTQAFLDVAWPEDLVTAPPSPTSWLPQAVGDDVFVRGSESRHECGIVFDERESGGWDGALQIARTGRAQLVRIGSRIRPKIARSRPVTHIFNGANLRSWAISSVDPAQQFNQATADILDRDREFQRVPVTRSLSDLDDGTLILNPQSKSFELRGITRRSQAIRELDLMLRTSRDLGLLLQFETNLSSLLVESGDVFYATIPTTEWAFSGQVLADAADPQEIAIDRETILAVATTYRACVQSADDNRLYFAQVTTAAGTYPSGTVVTVSADFTWTNPDDATDTMTHAPQEGDRWIIGVIAEITKTWEITDITLAPNFRRQIAAIEYKDSVFVDLVSSDNGDQALGDFAQPPPDDLPPNPGALTVEDGSSLSADTGAFRPAIYVNWSTPRTGSALGKGIRGRTEVWVAQAGTTPILAASVEPGLYSVTVEAPWIEPGRSYDVIVRPTGALGQKRGLARCASRTILLVGSVVQVDAPLAVSMEIVGDQAFYSAAPAAAFAARGFPIEIRRGPGWALAPRVAIVGPDSSFLYGPTSDWTVLPTSGSGVGESPLVARHLLPNGGYGAALVSLPGATVPEAASTFRTVSMEDDWTSLGDAVEPVAFDSMVVDAPTQTIEFTGSALSGSYTSGVYKTAEATGLSRRVHVSADVIAYQVPPYTPDDLDFPADSKRAEHWTAEGTTDPNDPLFGECKLDIRLIWTAGEGSPPNDQAFRPVDLFMKSCKAKVMVTRPDDTWDVSIERLALQIEPLKASELADFVDGGSY